MKVLLCGDFSGLHKNLKEGLLELGVDVKLASSGDEWKKIGGRDIDLSSCYPSILGKIDRYIKPVIKLQHMSGFDVVQLINPFIFPRRLGLLYNKSLIKYLLKHNEKSFMLSASDNSFYWQSRYRLKYTPLDDWKKYDNGGKDCIWEKSSTLRWNTWVANHVSGIIPISYEYRIGYEKFSNLLPTIPLPINVNKIQYTENKLKGKLIIFHGLNREGFKGTRYIKEAFSILKEKYPNDVECIIKGGMPFKEYKKLIRNVNVIVDQTFAYTPGMNALYSLAMGKIVLGGCEPEYLNEYKIDSSPIINITPNVNDIVSKIESLIENRHNLLEMGYHSRIYAENVHSHIKIANKYIKVWE